MADSPDEFAIPALLVDGAGYSAIASGSPPLSRICWRSRGPTLEVPFSDGVVGGSEVDADCDVTCSLTTLKKSVIDDCPLALTGRPDEATVP